MFKITKDRKERYPEFKEGIKAYIHLSLAMFICGSAVVASKMMVSTIPTFLVTELELLLGLLILLPLTFIIKKDIPKLDGKTHLILFCQALCGIFLYRIFIFIGLNYTTAATGGLISSISPLMVVILAHILLKEKLSVNQVIGIICVFIGLMMINLDIKSTSIGGMSRMKGNVLILAAVICEALFSVLSKVKCKPMTALYRTTIIAIDASILLLPFAVRDALNYDFMKMDWKTILCILYYGVFVSFLSYVLWFKGIEKVSAGKAAVFTSIVPISSIILSVILLKEELKLMHFVSLISIILGIWISCSNRKLLSQKIFKKKK